MHHVSARQQDQLNHDEDTGDRQAGLPVRPRVQARRNMSLFNAGGGYQGRREGDLPRMAIPVCRIEKWKRENRRGFGAAGAAAAAAIAAIRLFKVNERGRRARAAAAEQWVWRRRRRRWERERRNEQSKGIKGLNEGGREEGGLLRD